MHTTKLLLDEQWDELFKKLVPLVGKCDTVEGELIRAASKVIYRYYNDGDLFHTGYGCETAGASATYLLNSGVPLLGSLINAASCCSGKAYEQILLKIQKCIFDYVVAKNGQYENNTEDNLDTESKWENNYDDSDY